MTEGQPQSESFMEKMAGDSRLRKMFAAAGMVAALGGVPRTEASEAPVEPTAQTQQAENKGERMRSSEEARSIILEREKVINDLWEAAMDNVEKETTAYFAETGSDPYSQGFPAALSEKIDAIRAQYVSSRAQVMEREDFKLSDAEKEARFTKIIGNMVRGMEGDMEQNKTSKTDHPENFPTTWDEYVRNPGHHGFWYYIQGASRYFSEETMLAEIKPRLMEMLKTQHGIDEPTPPPNWQW